MTVDRVLPVEEAVRRTERDRTLLMEAVNGRDEQSLVAAYRTTAGPLGDFCESLRDLVAHVLMWDEINLAVLAEARRGRAHWSLDPRWERPEAGQRLNAAGVVAGRELPVSLLLHRFAAVRDALVDELTGYTSAEWAASPSVGFTAVRSIGSLAQYVMTVPGAEPYWHAAIHLDRLTEVVDAGNRGSADR
jgi:hypothetical protein